jgi:hypothetical protein
LVDPEKRFLISLADLRRVLSETELNTQASGRTLTDDQSAALEKLLPVEGVGVEGTDWTDAEVAALVADYFAMLRKEIAGQFYSKTEHRRALLRQINRSEGAIERKHQNVSAVLRKLGFPWIDGYKPLGNIQTSLGVAVAHLLRDERQALDAAVQKPIVSPSFSADVFVDRPDGLAQPSVPDGFEPVARKFDVAKRDAKNRELGKAGEEFVIAIEQSRLRDLGMHRQAADVTWISRDQGDGLGYDIRSFDDCGEQIFIEVKTTRGEINTPFFVSERERAVAEKKGYKYRLYRVFCFGKRPQIYVVKGALEQTLQLRPTVYRAFVSPAAAGNRMGDEEVRHGR